MKSVFIFLTVVILIDTIAFGQKSELNNEQIQSIQRLISTFKTNDKTKIANLVHYPLRREYPLRDVRDENDFIRRFDDIFDRSFLDRLTKSKINDWSKVGWRGIMFDNGALWIDEGGKIMTFNYQSPKEKQILINAIQSDKNQLPKYLQDFEKPVYLIITKNYKIRIDQTKEDVYRYVAWKIKNAKSEPDITIEKGVLEFQGNGGNHTITFNNNGYTYTISINEIGMVDTSGATLEVTKQDKKILTEDGKIERN